MSVELETNVRRMQVGEKEIILIGTAHVSPQSVEEVKELIEQESPDSVCIELCQGRYNSIVNKDKWQNTDIGKIIKEKQTMLLLATLIMGSFQKRIADDFEVAPGQEMIQGMESAEKVGAQLVLADRDIQVTMRRLWQKVGLKGKAQIVYELFSSIFFAEKITEEDLEEMKSQDMLDSALNSLSESFPELKAVLIDERDQYLAQKIKNAPGDKVIAVLGAGHLPGITQELYKENDINKLNSLKSASKLNKKWLWVFPVILIAIIGFTLKNDLPSGINQIVAWFLWNGSLSALGAVIALAHPLAILTAFAVAPISSMNPLLAAGWFSGLTEAYLRKPKVGDFQKISDDLVSIKGFWKNRVTRILLVVALTNLGSGLGTFIGGAHVLKIFAGVLG